MVQLALADNPLFELSTIEISRPGPHYAADTLRLLAEQNPTAGLVFLMGSDLLHNFPTWIRSAELVSICHFLAVVRRPGDSIDLVNHEKLLPGLTAKLRFVDVPCIGVSSHEIRARVAEGRPFRGFLPPSVYDYVIKHRLYCQ
jgi:nicotinate-nucleotide adenylyltransferase